MNNIVNEEKKNKLDKKQIISLGVVRATDQLGI
jgi:hypothetical protein